MRFVWDAGKAKANVAKHGVRFEKACEVFFDPLVYITDASVQGEEREATIGVTKGRSTLLVINTARDGGAIRIISARRVTRKEKTDYENHR